MGPQSIVNSFRFLGVPISEDLSWSHHAGIIVQAAKQRPFFPRRLRRFAMDSGILCNFCRCTIKSIQTGCIAALDSKALQRVVKTARHITRSELPALQDLYTRKRRRKGPAYTQGPQPQAVHFATVWQTVPEHPHPHCVLFRHPF